MQWQRLLNSAKLFSKCEGTEVLRHTYIGILLAHKHLCHSMDQDHKDHTQHNLGVSFLEYRGKDICNYIKAEVRKKYVHSFYSA